MTPRQPLTASCYPTWLSDIVATYVRNFPHRGQLKILRGLEILLGTKRWNVKTEYGFRIGVDRKECSQWIILKTAKWDDEVAQALIKNWSPEDVFYDLGTNIGYFTLLALEHGLKKTVSFEPFAPVAELADCNIQFNEYPADRFNLERVALGAKNQTAKYLPGPTSNTGEGRVVEATEGANDTISVITLDSYLESRNTPAPTIMKLDVEGSELDVFVGAENLLSMAPPHTIIFEADCEPDSSIQNSKIVKLLKESGYFIQALPKSYEGPKRNYLATLN